VLPATIKSAVTKLALHTQQIVTLQSQASAAGALVPGDWAALTLQAGWANVSGAIPAQVRLLTTTTIQLIANIENGTTADGTVIATLPAGYYNTVHSHTFSVTAVAGAAAVANPVSQGSLASTAVTAGALTDAGGSLTGEGGTPGNVINSSPVGTAPDTYTPSYEQELANRLNGTESSAALYVFPNLNLNSGAVGAQNVASGDLLGNQTTAISYNGPAITLSTSGTLTLYNVNENVTQVSFHESGLPLFTA
jgi:hypothetical protein